MTWFLLAMGAAIINSISQTAQKHLVMRVGYSKFLIAFAITAIASVVLFAISFIIGIPHTDNQFLVAILVTGVLNAIAWPLILKAYEIGEFSSVYSMVLLTPVFLLVTSAIFLGESPSPLGIFGVLLTVAGLLVITTRRTVADVPNFAKGNWLGIIVAAIFSISVNFDKIAVVHSDRFFGPAASLVVVAIGSLGYILARPRRLKLHISRAATGTELLLIGAMGMLVALSNVLHTSALLAGLASYTIAVKRLGVLFGVIWGWLFFKEKNISRKLLGAAVAVSGVIVILFSQ